MSTTLSSEEIARRGKELYNRNIRPHVEREHKDEFLVLDILTGEYEIATKDGIASERLLERCPNAVLYGVLIGSPVAYYLREHREPVH